MIRKRRKPDFLLVLVVVVGLGVIISMKLQPGAQAPAASPAVSVASTK